MIVRFLAYSGCRWGEMVALRRSSITRNGRRVRVKEAATEISGKLAFGTPKSLTLIPGVASAGGGGGSQCPGFATGTTVSMLDSCFSGTAHFAPTETTITISNDGELAHTFTAVDGSFDSGQLQPGETF